MQRTISKHLYDKAVFIFRRDHRLDDNTGLLYALENSRIVYPCFIFDPRQIHKENNKFFGDHCVQFMCESLADLNTQLKAKGSQLNYLYGEYPDIIDEILEVTKADLLCVNGDFTTFSKTRDRQIYDSCIKKKVEFKSFEDITLITKEQAMHDRQNGEFWQKYTRFYNSVKHFEIPQPRQCSYENFNPEPFELSRNKVIQDGGLQYYKQNDQLELKGGRTVGLEMLTGFKRLKDYKDIRDINTSSTKKGASKMSAYNKFGCVSIREVYWTTKIKCKGQSEDFVKQLFWRDFFYFIGEFFPEIWKGAPLQPIYSKLEWWNDEELYTRWKEGRIGFPIVDAAMRHMNATGFMTNRNRLIVSNYLIKDLHLNWQWGELYFAEKLVDYDPCQNNGGWQWSAGCGVDTQNYFRIFNPKIQSAKFDIDGIYIKKWIPELYDVPAGDLHNWEISHKKWVDKVDYPAPAVFHDVEKDRSVQMYLDSLGFDSEEAFGRYNQSLGGSGSNKNTVNSSKHTGTYGGGNNNNKRQNGSKIGYGMNKKKH